MAPTDLGKFPASPSPDDTDSLELDEEFQSHVSHSLYQALVNVIMPSSGTATSVDIAGRNVIIASSGTDMSVDMMGRKQQPWLI